MITMPGFGPNLIANESFAKIGVGRSWGLVGRLWGLVGPRGALMGPRGALVGRSWGLVGWGLVGPRGAFSSAPCSSSPHFPVLVVTPGLWVKIENFDRLSMSGRWRVLQICKVISMSQ